MNEPSWCDLHLHTTASDGTWQPLPLVRAAKAAGLSAIAVTDHDTTASVRAVQEAGRRVGIEVLSGIELSLRAAGQEVHILGYGIDPADAALGHRLSSLRERRQARADAILARLAAHGCPLDPDRVRQIAGRGSIGRPHIARALVERGYIPSIAAAFDEWLAEGRPAYVPRAAVEAEEGMAWIKEAGGVSVLAHPGLLKDEAVIPALVAAGLAGLEVYHPAHTPDMVVHFLRIAQAHDLLVTGGSDCHGPGGKDRVYLGRERAPLECWRALQAALAGPIGGGPDHADNGNDSREDGPSPKRTP
ncbi:MAG TPA: PHP domain-containing protein [Limnochordia bacterium]